MSYIDRNLMPDEKVVYRTHQHWVRLLGPGVALFLFLVLGVTVLAALNLLWLGLACFALALVNLIHLLVRYLHAKSLELAVTNKRVLVKSGLFAQQSIEILLSKVEAIVVEQTLLGRVLGYGSVSVGGTGGTKEHFHYIQAPHEFRSQVHAQST